MKQLNLPFIPPDPRDFRYQEDYGDDWRIVVKAFPDSVGDLWYEWTIRGPGGNNFPAPHQHKTCEAAVAEVKSLIDRL